MTSPEATPATAPDAASPVTSPKSQASADSSHGSLRAEAPVFQPKLPQLAVRIDVLGALDQGPLACPGAANCLLTVTINDK